MATPNESQALHEMSQILQGDWEAGLNFDIRASMVTFGFWRRGPGRQWRANPSGDMIDVQLFGQEALLNNLRVSMLKEVVGMGPQKYCVVFNSAPNFYSKLKLIMSYLPQEKMLLYPATARLEGPFLQEPWLSRGRALCSRPSLTFEEYHANFIAPYRW